MDITFRKRIVQVGTSSGVRFTKPEMVLDDLRLGDVIEFSIREVKRVVR